MTHLIDLVRAAHRRRIPDEQEITELIRDPHVPLADKTALLQRIRPEADEGDAWDVAMGAEL